MSLSSMYESKLSLDQGRQQQQQQQQQQQP